MSLSIHITICLCSECKLDSQIRHFQCSIISDWKIRKGNQNRKRMSTPQKVLCQPPIFKLSCPGTQTLESLITGVIRPIQTKETFSRFCLKTPNFNLQPSPQHPTRTVGYLPEKPYLYKVWRHSNTWLQVLFTDCFFLSPCQKVSKQHKVDYDWKAPNEFPKIRRDQADKKGDGAEHFVIGATNIFIEYILFLIVLIPTGVWGMADFSTKLVERCF